MLVPQNIVMNLYNNVMPHALFPLFFLFLVGVTLETNHIHFMEVRPFGANPIRPKP